MYQEINPSGAPLQKTQCICVYKVFGVVVVAAVMYVCIPAKTSPMVGVNIRSI